MLLQSSELVHLSLFVKISSYHVISVSIVHKMSFVLTYLDCRGFYYHNQRVSLHRKNILLASFYFKLLITFMTDPGVTNSGDILMFTHFPFSSIHHSQLCEHMVLYMLLDVTSLHKTYKAST